MSRHLCTVDLYKVFLQAHSIRYNRLALSEASPVQVSHDSVIRWLKETKQNPNKVWTEGSKFISIDFYFLLICNDTILLKKGTEHNIGPVASK